MKTPIQELIEEFRQCTSENMFIQSTINLAIEMAESKLEKEKQQISRAYFCGFDEDLERSGEQYYNETYKPE